MPELPRVRRTFRFLDLEQRTNDAYKKTLARWKDAYFEKGETSSERFIIKGKQREEMMNLYQIVGLAKVRPTVDYVEEVLDTENGEGAEKLVLFIEHIAVGDLLESSLNNMMKARGLAPVARIRGGVNAEDAEAIAKHIRNSPNCRVLIASTRGCGEGKDFSFCDQAIMVERQWNASNEEQAECRLIHPEKLDNFVDVIYMVARKTMDEPHAQLVEKKREICHKAVGEDVVKWDHSDFMQELMALMLKDVV
jgi:SNF2 family DNA or RNA helicase